MVALTLKARSHNLTVEARDSMARNIREVVEGLQHQGADEAIVYYVNTTNWAAGPTKATVKIFVSTALATNCATKLIGSPAISGNTITTPRVTLLTAGVTYLAKVLFRTVADTKCIIMPIQCDW